MYPEDIQDELIKRLTKERNYYKWLYENPEASEGLKKNAHLQFTMADTFSEPAPDTSDWEECSIENFKKWRNSNNFDL